MREIDVSALAGIWFHDVEVSRISVDYIKRVAELECTTPVGCWNSSNDHGLTGGEIKGTLVLSGLLYFVMEPPAPDYPYESGSNIEITAEASVKPGNIDMDYVSRLPQNLPDEAFLHYFFVNEWNSFIFVAAMDAAFQL